PVFAIDKITPASHPTYTPLRTLVLAELALHNGQYKSASKYYFFLASQQRQPYLAKQATLIALKLFDVPQAIKAAMLWGEIQPDDFFPQFVATTFLINSDRATEALPFLKNIYFQNESDAILATTLIYNGLSNKNAKIAFLQELEALTNAYPNHY